MKPTLRPRSASAAYSPSANVVLPRFMPVAARYTWRIGPKGTRPAESAGVGLGAFPDGGSPLDQRQRVLEPREHVRVDRVAVGMGTEALEDVGDQAEEHVRVGEEELR